MISEKSLECTARFDFEANAAYLKYSDNKIVKSKEEKMGNIHVVVDYDAQGNIVGYEILNLREFFKFIGGLFSTFFAMRLREGNSSSRGAGGNQETTS